MKTVGQARVLLAATPLRRYCRYPRRVRVPRSKATRVIAAILPIGESMLPSDALQKCQVSALLGSKAETKAAGDRIRVVMIPAQLTLVPQIR